MTEFQVLKDNIRVLLKLEFGTDVEIEGDWNLLTCLVDNNRKELMKDLVKNGFDLDMKNINDCTILMWCANYGQLEIMKLLLEHEKI